MEFVFYGSFVSVRKDEEKEEENEAKPIFEVAYLRNA